MGTKTMMERKAETKAVKNALKAIGINAKVSHHRGTAWGWLEINIGDARHRNGIEPDGHRFTLEEQALHEKVIKLALEVTGRSRNEYDGNISLLTQD